MDCRDAWHVARLAPPNRTVSPLRSRRSPRALAIALTISIALACGDYARTNPYDPNVAVQITVTGPDTLFSWGEQATYGATISPSMPDSAIEFGALAGFLAPIGRTATAILTNAQPSLYPATSTVSVDAEIGHLDTVETITIGNTTLAKGVVVWRHKGSKIVVLTQRITHIGLRCPNSHECDTLSAGGAWSVWVDPLDALNSRPYGLLADSNPAAGSPYAVFTLRDTSIASLVTVGTRVANITAKKSGSTWIVGTQGATSDSLRLVVR